MMKINICVEYIWLGGKNEIRSKTRIIGVQYDPNNPQILDNPSTYPRWNYDGSSTGQADGTDSEVIIVPRAVFSDPLREGSNKLCICDTYKVDGTPLSNNHRSWASDIFSKAPDEEPWFGLEQEYFIIDPKTSYPIGFNDTIPADHEGQDRYYCSVGTGNAFGREIAEEHLKCCALAGIKIAGINAEVAPGQWEFQIGPCVGIEQGDHLWVARYLLHRVAEKHGYSITFEPKPLKGAWNGSGCHTNYSTKKMREGNPNENKTGLQYIDEAIEKLSRKHGEHMAVYGTGNKERMTGKNETASYDKFTDDVANRGASIRRGNQTIKDKKGYFEDRRPSANCDPYLVTAKIFETTVLQ